MDESIIFSFAAIIVLGSLLFAVVTFTKKGTTHLDKSYYQTRWLALEHQLTRDNESSYTATILEADKLVDAALRQRGFSGNTMAERLKSANKQIPSAQYIWSSHKLRNRIAHEDDVRISYDDARRALAGFKQGLKDLGAL